MGGLVQEMTNPNRKQVVIIGGGFAGVKAASGLENLPVDVTLIDKNSYHVFQPLLYQAALGILAPSDITSPNLGDNHHDMDRKQYRLDTSRFRNSDLCGVTSGCRAPLWNDEPVW
jgi:NADPH-dependent 2,4-dienoyl-CoA reductase/sulfur reductase-like enzyme